MGGSERLKVVSEVVSKGVFPIFPIYFLMVLPDILLQYLQVLDFLCPGLLALNLFPDDVGRIFDLPSTGSSSSGPSSSRPSPS